jgi:hypothetical protein
MQNVKSFCRGLFYDTNSAFAWKNANSYGQHIRPPGWDTYPACQAVLQTWHAWGGRGGGESNNEGDKESGYWELSLQFLFYTLPFICL